MKFNDINSAGCIKSDYEIYFFDDVFIAIEKLSVVEKI